jgi:hypothetical protein
MQEYDDDLSMKRLPAVKNALFIGNQRIKSMTAWWDPAGGKRNRDDSVLALVAQDEDNHLYIHDTIKLTGDLEDQCEVIRQAILDYFLDRICVETNGIGYFAPQALKRKISDFKNVRVFSRRSTRPKKERITEAFEMPLAAGILHAHTRVLAGKLPGQMTDFDGNDRGAGTDDFLDSVSGAILEESPRPAKGQQEITHEQPNWRGQQTVVSIERDYASR